MPPGRLLLLTLVGSLMQLSQCWSDSTSSASVVPEDQRIDCYPGQKDPSEDACLRRGCIYAQPAQNGPPPCFFGHDGHSYRYASFNEIGTNNGWTTMNKNKAAIRVELAGNLSFSGKRPERALIVEFERYSTRVMGFRIKSGDENSKRFEVPRSLVKLAIPRRLNNPFYQVEYVSDPERPFAFRIIRRKTNDTLLDTSLGGLVFEERFVQIVTKLASPYVYGFGENQQISFRRPLDWNSIPLFSRHANPDVVDEGRNYAGVHPFFMVAEKEGNAHGIFLLNSNAMEYKLQPAPALTLRTFGGVLEFLVCFGATPNDVIIEYTQTIGRPAIPPYWALGLHESARIEEVEKIIGLSREADLPLDVLHIYSRAIDHEWSVSMLDEKLRRLVKRVQDDGGHAILVVYAVVHLGERVQKAVWSSFYKKPPHVRVDSEDDELRAAYQEGLWKDVYVKWSEDSQQVSANHSGSGPSGTLFGQDKAGRTVAFVDFLDSNAVTWWEKWLTFLYARVRWDGLRLNDNQPFWPSRTRSQKNQSNGTTELVLRQCSADDAIEKLGITPAAISVWNSTLLSDETLCMGAQHDIDGTRMSHYDAHSLYGLAQAIATKKIVEKLTNKRGIVFTASSFATSGTAAAVWLPASLDQPLEAAVRQSIAAAFNFNMFGMTVAGANVEKVPDNEELCWKWQMFTMFHVLPKSVALKCLQADGTPYPSVLRGTRAALHVRYTLLPYLYTLFFHGWMEGEAIMRHLIYEYNWKDHDTRMLDADDIFFWGSAVLFIPNLGDRTSRSVYLPHDTFYSIAGDGLRLDGKGGHQNVSLPFGVWAGIRAGYVIPVQGSDMGVKNLRDLRRRPFGLLIGSYRHSDGSAAANGNFWMDDGDSIDTIEKHDYMSWFIYNRWQEGSTSRALLDYDIERNELPHTEDLKFSSFMVCGYDKYSQDKELTLRLDGKVLSERSSFTVSYDEIHETLLIKLDIPLNRVWKLEILHQLSPENPKS